MDFYVRRWPPFLTLGPPEYCPLLPSSCRSKLETLIDLGLGGLASWWLHCLAPRSPLTAYCVARAHADGLTAAPSLAYPILHGATLEGGGEGACEWGRAGDSAGLTEALAGPAIFFYSIPHKSSCEPAKTTLLIRTFSFLSCAGSFASSEGRGGRIRPPTRRSVGRLFPMATVQVCGQAVGGC